MNVGFHSVFDHGDDFVDDGKHQTLESVGAVKTVGIVQCQELKLLQRIGVIEDHGSRKASTQRQNRIFRDAFKSPFVIGRLKNEFGGGDGFLVGTDKLQGQIFAVATDQTDENRNHKRVLFSLPGCRRRRLRSANREGAVVLIPVRFHGNARGAGLRPP